MATRKVRLEICGSSYIVSTNDTEDYLIGLAEQLDEDMKKIMAEAPNASVASAAVISALGYLDEAAKNAMGADNMRAQIQDYLEDAAKAKMAAEGYRREVERLKRELAYYEKKRPKATPREEDKPAPPTAAQAVSALRQGTPRTQAEEPQLEGQLGLDELEEE